MIITSVNNEIIKETAKLLQKKYRDESGLFLLEGEKSINEAYLANINIKSLFVLEGSEAFSEKNPIYVTEPVISKMSDTKSAPVCIAVAQKPEYNPNDIKSMEKVILLENIKDAGNLGTIIRTAAAFGIEGIVLFGDTVDFYSPKCVRSSVGNLWKTKIFKTNDLEFINKYFSGFEKAATLPLSNNSVKLSEYKPKGNLLVMFGSESEGLSPQLKNIADVNLTIEMKGNVESLNLGISAALVMYEISKVFT